MHSVSFVWSVCVCVCLTGCLRCVFFALKINNLMSHTIFPVGQLSRAHVTIFLHVPKPAEKRKKNACTCGTAVRLHLVGSLWFFVFSSSSSFFHLRAFCALHETRPSPTELRIMLLLRLPHIFINCIEAQTHNVRNASKFKM